MNKIYNLKKIQLICPNCKYEFPYNKNSLDKRIKYIGQLIFEKAQLIAKLKKFLIILEMIMKLKK